MYDRPDNVFVAGFIGSPAMNLLDVPVVDGGVTVGGTTLPVERSVLAAAGGSSVTMGVRPEDLDLSNDGRGLPVVVEVVEELGADAYIYGVTALVTAPKRSSRGSTAVVPRRRARRCTWCPSPTTCTCSASPTAVGSRWPAARRTPVGALSTAATLAVVALPQSDLRQ
jgi:ABC-type sugar transport system ATPase subunit